MTVRRWVAGCALATCVVASCGRDVLAPRAARDLAADYELVASAVENGDRVEARRSVRALMRSAEELEAAGAIDADRAEAIRAAVEQVLADLGLLPAPSPSPSIEPSATPAPPSSIVEPEASDEGDGYGHSGSSAQDPGNSGGKGNGKGHGHAKGHDKG